MHPFSKPEQLLGLEARTSKEGTRRMAQESRLVGIDVAKGKIDAAIRAGAEAAFANSVEGHRELLAWLQEHGVALAGLILLAVATRTLTARALRPLQRLRESAAGVSTTRDLTTRVATAGRPQASPSRTTFGVPSLWLGSVTRSHATIQSGISAKGRGSRA